MSIFFLVFFIYVTQLPGKEKVQEVEEGKEGEARQREGEPQGQTPGGVDPQQAREASQGLSQGFRRVRGRGGAGGAGQGGSVAQDKTTACRRGRAPLPRGRGA